MRKLLKYFKPHIFAIVFAIIFLFLQVLTDLALPSFMADIINDGIIKNDIQFVLVSGIKMLCIALAGVICASVVGFLASRIAAKTSLKIRSDVFEKVTNFANSEFDQFSTASLITRSTNDIQQVQMIVVMFFRMVLMAPIMGVGALVMAYKSSSSMTWTIVLALLLVLGMMLIIFSKTMPKFKFLQTLVDKLNLIMNERLTGILVIRAFNTEIPEEERFDNVNKQLTKINLFVNRIMVFMMPMMMLIMNGISILILWVGADKINIGLLQVGNLLEFVQYAMLVIMSFMMMSMVFIMLPRALVSADRVSEVLLTEPSINDKAGSENSKIKDGVIEFKNVSFKYPDADEYVLHNINFVAEPGKTTAFIGSTGSGKSTIVNLIPRFYDTSEGEVLIDGIDVRDLNQHELRKNIGYVPQKAVLFSGTIESNILYGIPNAEENFAGKNDVLNHSASIAQAENFINEKEKGFESEIAQGGTNVSGGQKQRLSIARALAVKPKIYIFDDSFSALDYRTDASLRKALKSQVGEAVIIIVAQRISTIKSAEQIVVLNNGEIAGIGTHKELLETCEVYQEIAESQLDKEEM